MTSANDRHQSRSRLMEQFLFYDHEAYERLTRMATQAPAVPALVALLATRPRDPGVACYQIDRTSAAAA